MSLYNVEYDYPAQAATGESCATPEEAERIKAERIKAGCVNVRIEWESGCDCGTCDDCMLAYELSKRGLTAVEESE